MYRPRLTFEGHEDADTLRDLYRAEQEVEIRTRLQALWLIRQGYPVGEAARLVGVQTRAVYQWLAWYREGGLEALRQHRQGGRQGREPFLSAEQCAQLAEHAAQGHLKTIAQAVDWVQEQLGITYTYWGMRSLFVRLKITRKTPRPLAAKASLEAQEGWKKGGLQTLSQAMA